MNNIIIHEENNNLIIKDDYSPLVCGNTNYTLEFVFGEDWQKTTNKIAVFFVGDQKTAVPFTGSLLSVPALPNAQIMQLVLMTAETENTRLVSSVLDINLKPTILLETIPELKPLSRYAEEMLTKIDALENGTLEVSNSKHSQVAEFASNVSNPNLLINGDFKVNQRGNTTYTEAGKYTVDRWKLLSGTVDVAENGIVLNGTIIQKLEHSPNAPVVASSNAGSIFYKNGAVTISTTTPTLISFAKLEVGTTATPFSPRSYAEELAMCQRYYQILRIDSACYLSNINSIYPNVNLVNHLRIKPTIVVTTYPSVRGEGKILGNLSNLSVTSINHNILLLHSKPSDLDISVDKIYIVTNGLIEADSEIY